MAQTETDRVFDELLVTMVQAGDRRAADRLAARWQPRLIRTARRLLRDDDAARDAVQEAWEGIFRGALRLGDPARFPAWAFGILHRKCADRIRRLQRDRAAPEIEVQPQGAADDRVAIDQAFASLGHEHRAAAQLHFGEGLTLAEVASATGVPIGTAKSRIFHARRRLCGRSFGRRMMATIDDRIRGALSAEDEAFLQGLEHERGMFAQLGDTFRGPMGRWTMLVFVVILALTGVGAWAIVEMFAAPDTRTLILWTSLAWAVLSAITALKMWAWARMNTLSVLREIKRVEVRVARLER